MPHSRARAAVALLALAALGPTGGCASLGGLTGSDAGAEKDATRDVERDAGKDAGKDAAPACEAIDGGFHDFTSKPCWSTYSIPASLDPDPIYAGGTFDGRYVYFVNNQLGTVARCDSHAEFTSDGAWSAFEAGTLQISLDAGAEDTPSGNGLVFDGRYVYVVPGNGAVFVRYDTHEDFGAAASWSAFAPNPSAETSYAGGTFDGRFVYFAPSGGIDGNDSGVVTRFDTTQSFTSLAAWSSLDLTTLPGANASSAIGFYGAVFDGQYVYFVPSAYNVVPRFDTTGDFATAASWETFLVAPPLTSATGFATGMFDGSHVVLIPQNGTQEALEYDITKSFGDASSWQAHTPAPNAFGSELAAGAYDGRFLYFVPGPIQGSPVVRYDDTPGGPSFATPGFSWTTFDSASIHAAGFGAAVFDGRYLYLAPNGTEAFARFDAKDTASQPSLPHYFGSFF